MSRKVPPPTTGLSPAPPPALPPGHPGPARGTDCYISRPWGRQWDCGCDDTAAPSRPGRIVR